MAPPTRLEWVERPWGAYLTVFSSPEATVKVLRVNPRSALSLQYHEHREEHWLVLSRAHEQVKFVINGSVLTPEPDVRYDVPKRIIHRITNNSDEVVEILEVMTGHYDEDDIVRLNDRYGRD